MKKLKFLVGLCAATLLAGAVYAAPLFSGSVDKKTLKFDDNHQYGKNYQFMGKTGDIFPADYKAQKGDVIKVHLVGTVNNPLIVGKGDDPKEPISYWCGIVDLTPAAKYFTKLNEDNANTKCNVQVDKDLVVDVEFKIVKDSTTSAGKDGSNFVMGTSNNQKKPVTITVKEFTYEITR